MVDLWLDAAIGANSSTSWRIHAKRFRRREEHPAGARSAIERSRESCLEARGLLLDVLGRMEVWLAHHGRAGLPRRIA